jgi:hypothetical protein
LKTRGIRMVELRQKIRPAPIAGLI